MPKYHLFYTMCDGAFMMDVCTGHCIIAEDREKAMQAAKRLDCILSKSFDLRCCFDLSPKPHISIQSIDKEHQRKTQPKIFRFQVQKNVDSPQKLLGYPVFSDDDFQDVTETDFVKRLVKEYSGFLKSKNKSRLEFECINYGVIPQESK